MSSLGLPAKEQAVALLSTGRVKKYVLLTLQTDNSVEVFSISNSKYIWNQWWIFFCYVRLEGTCHASNSESFGIFIFSRNQLEEWLLNDQQTETGQKSMAFWPASFAYGNRCLGFWPFEATKKKKFRFFRHNRLDGAQEMENGDFFRVPVFLVGFLSFQNLKFSIHQKVRFPLERFRTWIYRRRFFFWGALLGVFCWVDVFGQVVRWYLGWWICYQRLHWVRRTSHPSWVCGANL